MGVDSKGALIYFSVHRNMEFAVCTWQQSLRDPESAVVRFDLLPRTGNLPIRLHLHGRRPQEPGPAFYDVERLK